MNQNDDLCARLLEHGTPECQHKWNVTSACPLCLRARIVQAVTALRELEAERRQMIELITIRHCDTVEGGKTILDFYEVWLRQERERAERAEAERDALRRDAERYRWLRANARRIDFAGLSWTQGCELDGRIDAALGSAHEQ